jgi:ankyrin repeat protein
VLLDHGADVDVGNDQGETPLHLVSRGKYDTHGDGVGTARLLLDRGADVHAQDADQNTALHLASFKGKFGIARVLLDYNANPNARSMDKTLLHLLMEGNDPSFNNNDEHIPDLAQVLVKNGADVDIRLTNEWTPLHVAAFNGWLELARSILDHGANPNAENDRDETPLHLVSRGEYHFEENGVHIALLLLEHGVDVHSQDKEHYTALHAAAFKGKHELTRVLLNHGANPNVRNEKGKTPLHLVPQDYEGDKIATLLLERGADVNARDKDDATPSHSVAFKRRLDIAKVLLFL